MALSLRLFFPRRLEEAEGLFKSYPRSEKAQLAGNTMACKCVTRFLLREPCCALFELLGIKGTKTSNR